MSDFIPTTGNGIVPLIEVTPYGTVGTDFLAFAIGSGANIESQVDYQNDPQRPTGNLPGIARSNFNNKAIRQGTFVAHSLCLWISQQIQQYVYDDGNDIAWIGEFSSALANFVVGMLPSGPDLGAYLPLAGGTMSGHIYFNSGVSTILSNQTWYYAKDNAGVPRGMMLKGTDNNIYIGDGTSTFTFLWGFPTTQNNMGWCGQDTGGVTHRIISLMNDNATHIYGEAGSGNIFMDCSGGGSVWVNSNVVIPNNQWYYAKDTGGNARNILGLTTLNSCYVNWGGTGSCDLFAGGGQPIYFHNYTVALSTFQSNGYAWLNGGGRAYISGGNDPWQIRADNGFYARIQFSVGNTRAWSAGTMSSGYFGIGDESAQQIRFEIDFDGNIYGWNGLNIAGSGSFGGNLTCTYALTVGTSAQVNGGLTIYNSLNIASGDLSVAGSTWLHNGLTVWNGISLANGDLWINNGWSAYVTGQLTVYNNFVLNAGYCILYSGGGTYIYSDLRVSARIYIGGMSEGLWDGGNNVINFGGRGINIYQGSLWTTYFTCGSSATFNGPSYFNSGLQVSSGNSFFYGGTYAFGGLTCQNGMYNVGNLTVVNGTSWLGQWGGSWGVQIGRNLEVYDSIFCGSTGNWSVWLSSPFSGNPLAQFKVDTYFGVNGGPQVTLHLFRELRVYTADRGQGPGAAYRDNVAYWDILSDPRFKDQVGPYETGLADLLKLEPKRYRLLSLEDRTPLGRSVGLMADEAEKIMPDMVFEHDMPLPQLDPVNGKDTTVRVKMMNTSELQFAMLNAIKELAERIEQLEEQLEGERR